jgi:cell division protein FtsZ
MINSNLEGVQFVVANTDAQALDAAMTENVIQLGTSVTQGLGAGANPDTGRAAAEESLSEIGSHFENSNMVFITAGMGGGTGTGAAPVIARMAKEQGILTVGVVTKPFQFEGGKRMRIAEEGLRELQQYVDTLIVIPNQNLFRIANEKTTFADAFRMADEVLHSGVRGVTDLIVKPGLVNLDFNDIRTVMREMGKAMMGTGEASGEKRALEAAEAAISNPLLDDISLKGARAALINITGGLDMTLFEVDEAVNRVREEVDPDANIIFGSTFNENLQGAMRVSVVATGIDADALSESNQEYAASQAAQNKRPFSYMPPRRPGAGTTSTAAPAARPAAVAPAPAAPTAKPAAAAQAPAARMPVKPTSVQAAAPVPATPKPTAKPQVEPVFEEDDTLDFMSEPTVSKAPAESADDHGPLFFGGERPVSASRAQPAMDEESAGHGFGFLNRIAEVSRALSQRNDDPAPAEASGRVRTVEITADKPAESAASYTAGREEENYDIPAFLRRQAN